MEWMTIFNSYDGLFNEEDWGETLISFAKPIGAYAFPRAVLICAIFALDQASKKMIKNIEIEPDVNIGVPSLPLFRSFLDPTSKYKLAPGNPETGKDFSLIEKNRGTIYIDEAIIDTYIYICRSRNFLLHSLGKSLNETLERGKVRIPFLSKRRDHVDIPSEVIKEIDGLIECWDKWKPNSRLDNSVFFDILGISPTATTEDQEILHLAMTDDPLLFRLVFFVLSHEYGHYLINNDEQNGIRREYMAYEFLNSLLQDKDSRIIKLQNFLKDMGFVISRKWCKEIAADIYGYELYMYQFSTDKNSLVFVFAILSFMVCLIESYSLYKKGNYNATENPPSFIRFYVLMKYLSNHPDWDSSKSRISVNIITDILLKLQAHYGQYHDRIESH